MFARTCTCEKDFVSLHAFCVYGGDYSTYRQGAERERKQRARGDCADQRLLRLQGANDVYVLGKSAKRNGCADVGTAASGR